MIKSWQFKKGQAPPPHKEGCLCLRCSHIPWNKGVFGVVKQTPESIAKRVAKLKGHGCFNPSKHTDDEIWMRRLNRQRRRNEILSSPNSHTEEEWEALKNIHQHMCLCCKRQEPEIKLTKDHILPISRGGDNRIENIQPLCTACNNSKFTKHISFLPSTNLILRGKEVNNLIIRSN